MAKVDVQPMDAIDDGPPDMASRTEPPQEHIDKMQEHLAEGLPLIRQRIFNPTRINRISILRTGTMCSVATFITAGLLVPLIADVNLSDPHEASAEAIKTMDICSSKDPSVVNSTGWQVSMKLGAEHRYRKILFKPTYAEGQSLALPDLEFLDSEGWRFAVPSLHHLLSFGLLSYPALKQPIFISSTAGCAGVEPSELINRFGVVAIKALKAVDRRELALAPSSGIPIQRTYGSILLRTDTDVMMHPETHVFGPPFKHGNAWQWLQILNLILIVFLTSSVLLLGGKMVYEDWLEGVAEWVLQYDYLWQLRDLREGILLHHTKKHKEDNEEDSDEEKQHITVHSSEDTRKKGVFTSYIQACTPFFIFDHIVGNVIKNSEEYKFGFFSSALHGLIMALFPMLPALAGFFYEDVRVISIVLLIVNYVALMAFAPCYYFGVAFWKRKVPLYLVLISLSICVVTSVTYLVAVVLFLAQMIMADAEMVIGIILALGSLFIYPLVVIGRFKQIRSAYKHIQKKEGAKRGKIAKGWEKSKLSTRWIYIAVSVSTVELVLLAGMILFASAIFGGARGFDKLIPSITVPIATGLKASKQVLAKKELVNTNWASKVVKVTQPADKLL